MQLSFDVFKKLGVRIDCGTNIVNRDTMLLSCNNEYIKNRSAFKSDFVWYKESII